MYVYMYERQQHVVSLTARVADPYLFDTDLDSDSDPAPDLKYILLCYCSLTFGWFFYKAGV